MKPSFNTLLVIAALIVVGVYYFNGQSEFSDNAELEEWAEDYRDHEEYSEEKNTIIFKRASFGVLDFNTNSSPKKILVETVDGTAPILVRDIEYCEKKGNYVDIISTNKTITSKETLSDLKDKINDPFFIFDNLNSFIINFDYVNEVIKKRSEHNQNTYTYKIKMQETSINLPKEKKKKFMNELDNYVKQYQ